MGQIWIKDFTGGLDGRRMPITTAGGVLLKARDGHITPGGEFEKRAAFVPFAALPPGTTGLAAIPSGLVVFGSASIASNLFPPGVAYHQLTNPNGSPLVKILSVAVFKSLDYAVAQFADGSILHFYNGQRVQQTGTFVRTIGSKLYSADGPSVRFSAVQDPTSTTGTGAGFIDMSSQADGFDVATALAKYQKYVAIFAGRVVQIWYMDPDPTQNQQVQVLNNTGTFAPRSVTQFGDADLFYLDESGLRSLRARDASNAASTTDVGSPIDVYVVYALRGFSLADRANIIGAIEPQSSRFWLSVPQSPEPTIFVFSFFSGANVSAWTRYFPGFQVDDMVSYQQHLYLRSGDQVYVYGGLGVDPTYDATVAEAYLPYMDAGEPTKEKTLTAIDVAAEGDWQISVGMDPNNIDMEELVSRVTGSTYNQMDTSALGRATHFSVRARTVGSGAARLGATVIGFE